MTTLACLLPLWGGVAGPLICDAMTLLLGGVSDPALQLGSPLSRRRNPGIYRGAVWPRDRLPLSFRPFGRQVPLFAEREE